jgi:4-hydroxy-3-methylbut-2-enyl diphosphate reductase
MSDLVICTPLRAEQAAALAAKRRRGTRIERIGMGPARTRAAVDRLPADGPLAVLGVAGGLQPHVLPGHIVVAAELAVHGGEQIVRCPSAPVLAAALREVGLTVHVGRIVSTDHIVHGEEFASLAETGALAVDMETGYLAERLDPQRPVAVVRVISDTAEEPLLSLSVVRRGIRALGMVRRAVPVIERWAETTGPRALLLGSPRSFCAGVDRAIEIVERAIARYGAPVYVRRQIVHNAHVVADLEARGAVFVTELDEVPDGARTVLAAHGVSPEVRRDAVARSLEVIDATCPLVAKVHTEVRRYAATDHTVLLIGHADHEEVVGSAGEAPDQVRVVESEADARTVEVADPGRVAYAMQTTLAVDDADRIASVLRERFPQLRAPRHDDICYATTNRQRATREIAARCDLVLVIGSTNSSNSLRLVEVARRAGAPAYLIEDATAVELDWLRGVATVGITAGASAPPHLVDDLVDVLSGLGAVAVNEHRAVDEDVTFTLPKEVA